MKPVASIDEYIGRYPAEVQEILQKVRQAIRETAPEAEEAMQYGIPTFKLHGSLVHFGMFKEHLGFYPTPSGISGFKDELKPYKHAKGSVRFPLDEPIPYELIKRITAFRVKEQTGEK